MRPKESVTLEENIGYFFRSLDFAAVGFIWGHRAVEAATDREFEWGIVVSAR